MGEAHSKIKDEGVTTGSRTGLQLVGVIDCMIC